MPIGSNNPDKTSGFLKEAGWFSKLENGVLSSANPLTPGPMFEPTPLAAGSAATGMSWGSITLVANLALHITTAVLTILAATAHLKPGDEDKDLTPTHAEDYVRRWCMLMIIFELVGVGIYVLWYGLIFKAMSNPIPAILGGGSFFITFVCTLKLTYYLEIGSLGWTDPADGASKNANDLMHSNYDGDVLAQWSLILQCFVIASILFTPISGTYYKLINKE